MNYQQIMAGYRRSRAQNKPMFSRAHEECRKNAIRALNELRHKDGDYAICVRSNVRVVLTYLESWHVNPGFHHLGLSRGLFARIVREACIEKALDWLRHLERDVFVEPDGALESIEELRKDACVPYKALGLSNEELDVMVHRRRAFCAQHAMARLRSDLLCYGGYIKRAVEHGVTAEEMGAKPQTLERVLRRYERARAALEERYEAESAAALHALQEADFQQMIAGACAAA